MAETIAPETKREWSQNLQRRVMRLLLLHDRPLFREKFRTLYTRSSLPQPLILQQYDRYLRLANLSDELLDDIMPRIRRQLSLQTDRTRLCEQAPTRGRIDWPRTVRRGWQESPGQPALRFDTHLRQHSTATPENILTVAILLVYQDELRGMQREGLGDEGLADQELQILTGAAERIERELAAPYAHALVKEVRQYELTHLVDQVEAGLRPGANPYRDLIEWWRRVRRLQIGRSVEKEAQTLASEREDKGLEAWLYELWVTLEFIHFLDQEHKLIVEDDAPVTVHATQGKGVIRFLFRWGVDERRFRFTYSPRGRETANETPIWENAPDAWPDYTIERDVTQQVAVTYANGDKQVEVWREPPVALDAKYYLSGNVNDRTRDPIKKLLADMALLYLYDVVLLFPQLADVEDTTGLYKIVEPSDDYHSTGRQQDCRIHLYQLQPNMDVDAVQRTLRAVLEHAVEHLPARPSPTCQGMWLDQDTVNDSAQLLADYNIICPKPHIGPGVFDLVHSEHHCLKDPRLCHVFGLHQSGRQQIVPPRVVRVTSRDDLIRQSTMLREQHTQELRTLERGDAGAQERAEQIRERVIEQVGRTIEQYVKLRGNTRAIEEHFQRWIFQGHWKEGPRQLRNETRDMLVSGEYVWHEYTEINLNDWAAPAIQYCRALEHEVRHRLYHRRQADFHFRRGTRWTLGTLDYLYTHRHARTGDDAHNWALLRDIVTGAGSTLPEFEAIVERFVNERIVEHRNHLAHGEPIPQSTAETIRNVIIGHRNQPGILCWLVEHLDTV